MGVLILKLYLKVMSSNTRFHIKTSILTRLKTCRKKGIHSETWLKIPHVELKESTEMFIMCFVPFLNIALFVSNICGGTSCRVGTMS